MILTACLDKHQPPNASSLVCRAMRAQFHEGMFFAEQLQTRFAHTEGYTARMADQKASGSTGSAQGALPARPPSRTSRDFDDEMPDLTDAQRDELRRMLEAKRSEITASIESRQSQERDAERDVGDEMDDANTEGITAMTSRLLERDVQLLGEIDRALAKFRSGDYGYCEGTGEPIGYGRLRSRPWARFSVAHQEQLERESRARGGI